MSTLYSPEQDLNKELLIDPERTIVRQASISSQNLSSSIDPVVAELKAFLEKCLTSSDNEDAEFLYLLRQVAVAENLSVSEVKNQFENFLAPKLEEISELITLSNERKQDLLDVLALENNSPDAIGTSLSNLLLSRANLFSSLAKIIKDYWNYFPLRPQKQFEKAAYSLCQGRESDQRFLDDILSLKEKSLRLVKIFEAVLKETEGKVASDLFERIKEFVGLRDSLLPLDSLLQTSKTYSEAADLYIRAVFNQVPHSKELSEKYKDAPLPVLLYCTSVFGKRELQVCEVSYDFLGNSLELFTVFANSSRSERNIVYDLEWDISNIFPTVSISFRIIRASDSSDVSSAPFYSLANRIPSPCYAK